MMNTVPVHPNSPPTVAAPFRGRLGDDGGAANVRAAERRNETAEMAETAANSDIFESDPSLARLSVDDINAGLSQLSRSIRFRLHPDSGQIQVQIVDIDSDRILRSIPSEEMVQLAVRLREFSGVGALIDTVR